MAISNTASIIILILITYFYKSSVILEFFQPPSIPKNFLA